MFEVLKPGLETSVQELPGRIGFWEQGFPPSGPMDIWSFRLANLLVGNPAEAAALECQILGPSLKAETDCVIAITGADMAPKVDGEPIPLWQSFTLRGGQVLELGAVTKGARSYIAFAGGIDTPPVLGSRATFHMAGVGGMEGYALKEGQDLPVMKAPGRAGASVPARCRPPIDGRATWDIEVVAGPNDDWIDDAGRQRFLSADWKLQAKSNRTGFRLEGPEWSFSGKALNKRPEHGQDPSNILDHGYPFGAVNLAGQTPIILVNDGPSTGGFINPYTVISAAFWKLGQSLPGNVYRFTEVSLDEAVALRRELLANCGPDSIEVVD